MPIKCPVCGKDTLVGDIRKPHGGWYIGKEYSIGKTIGHASDGKWCDFSKGGCSTVVSENGTKIYSIADKLSTDSDYWNTTIIPIHMI